MHTFSPAKMWITGLDHLRKPLLHLHTQANQALPWAEIDMDFMNLNQAAHGDREFAACRPASASRARPWSGTSTTPRSPAGSASGPAPRSAARRWRTMRLARFGDNMRNVAVTEGDKVEAERRFGVSVNTWGVNDLVAVVDEVADADIDALVAEYADIYDVQADLLPGGDRHESLRYGARIELGLRAFLTDGGFTAFTTNFEDLGGLRQLPGLAVQRLMADGYGFGGEGDWKTSVMLRTLKVVAGHGRGPARRHVVHGGLHLPPGPRRGEDPRRAHARGLPVHRGGTAEARDPPARDRRPGGPGPAGLRRRGRPGRRPRHRRPGRPVPLRGQRDRRRTSRRAAAPAAGRARGLAAAARSPDLRRRPG